MYANIKELADKAIALQNKNGMEAALRDISVMCVVPKPEADAIADKTDIDDIQVDADQSKKAGSK